VVQRGLTVKDAGLRSRRSLRRARLIRTITVASIVAVLGTAAIVATCSQRSKQPVTAKPSAVVAVASKTLPARPKRSAVVTPPVALLAQPGFDREPFIGRPIQSVATTHKEVALTFDDGPSVNTPKFLSLLAKNKAHATFFMVGYRAWHYPLFVYQAVSQGNEVGNHTWGHIELKKLGSSTLRTQIDRTQAMLMGETGEAPIFIRPRSGKIDASGLAAAKKRGLVVVLWSSHANDIEDILPPDELVSNALEGVHPGSIILMHETNSNTLKALPLVLAELKRKGLKPVTLSHLLADAKK
jgi:peptidoglycan/xylan/chitin deacetylase (PgdA/CDA1 family)